MNDLILKAREEQMIEEKTSLVKSHLMSDHGVSAQWCSDNHLLIKEYVATTPGQRAKDIGAGMMGGAANWANQKYFGGEGPLSASGAGGKAKGLARRAAQTVMAPIRAAGKLGNLIGDGLETAAVAGQQANTGIRPNEQKDLSRGQGQARKNDAKSTLQTAAYNAGKVAPDASKGETVEQASANAEQANQDINNVPAAPDLDALTADQKVQQANQGMQQQQAQAPKGSPQEMAQAAQIQQAQQQANTKGGIGTGVISNLLTFGGAGALRGAYNAYQRNQGQQRLNQYAQGNFTRSLQFQNELNDAYGVLALRKGNQARNTTEMLRNGRRRQV